MRPQIPWLLLAAIALGSTIAGCGGDDTPAATATTAAPAATATTAAAPTDLVATKKAPASMAADDAAWKDARVTTVNTGGVNGSASTGPVAVKVQALYSDTDIWFRFEWSDATKTTARDWVWDETKWKAPTGQQDRLSLMWQLTPDAAFAPQGCATLCHHPDNDAIAKWYMVSPAGTPMDNWQWTAGISNGMNQFSDASLSDKVPDPTALGAPFVVDPNTGGGNVANTNDAKDGPKMMQDPTKKPSLGTDYLLVSEAVALDVTKLKAGDKVPNALLAPFTGDRGDIDAKGAWSNGAWVVVAHRKLDTGNPDDAKFTVGGSFPFGLAVWNDLGNVDHTVSTAVYLLKLK
jgi:Ethylbenzene dehydrogenase